MPGAGGWGEDMERQGEGGGGQTRQTFQRLAVRLQLIVHANPAPPSPHVAGRLLGVEPLEARLPQRHRVVPPRVQRHAKSHLPTDAVGLRPRPRAKPEG